MQQEIQTNQPADRLVAEAAAFFTKRRAKVSERTERGFRFGLEGGDEQEGGRVTVAPAKDGGSTVTVQADGLGVLAIAEGFIRELRKQARDASRVGRSGAATGGFGSGFADLRQRLGMPEPPPPRERVERPPRQAPVPAAAETERTSVPPVPPAEATPGEAAAAVAPATGDLHQPVPAHADVPAAGESRPAGEQAAAAAAAPGHESLATQAASAEEMGGVPRAAEAEAGPPVEGAPSTGQEGVQGPAQGEQGAQGQAAAEEEGREGREGRGDRGPLTQSGEVAPPSR
ncbi:MAG TPA: hypothetical protein VHS99_26715 [Chloroflexota bacterium]|nr:hypothetical protein [Chloroflexota bacterium]